MPKILVLFHSRTGNTAAVADAIAEGARSVRFAEVDVRRIDDLVPESASNADPAWKAGRDALAAKYHTLRDVEELAGYDGLVLGSPSRDGVMSAELAHLLDQAGPLQRRGAFANKVGSAFTPEATGHRGQETTLWSIMTSMVNLGLILVPPSATDLATAQDQGKRVAEVVGWMTHARSHHHH